MRVLYIAGASRSGSTLLARLLDRYAGAPHLGELTFLWERSLRDHEMCGCGRPLAECPLWSQVLARFDALRGHPWGDDLDALVAARAEIDYLPRFATGREVAPETWQLYRDAFAALFAAVGEVTGRSVVIDSSKRPAHGALLTDVPGLTVDVVHLVRDPRAVAYSAVRAKPRPDSGRPGGFMPTNKPWRTAARWDVHNALTERLRSSAASYRVVLYEDLLADPQSTMASLLDDLGLEPAHPLAELASRRADLDADHSVSGNPVRFVEGPTELTVDDAWRSSLGRRQRATALAITLPLLVRYRRRARRGTARRRQSAR